MVKHKMFLKSSFKSIFRSISRFLAMLSIVFLSTAVITGLLVTGPNIKKTMTEEYINQNTLDINFFIPPVSMLEDISFNEESIDYIKNNTNLKDVEAFNLKETKSKYNNYNEINTLYYEYDFNNKINKVKIIDKLDNFNINNIKENEVLVERETYHLIKTNLGDKLEIDGKEYVISAIVENMFYFNKEAEKSLTTNETYKLIVYKHNDNLSYFSNIFATINKDKINDHFHKSYKNKLKKEINFLEENIIDELLNNRKEDILEKYSPLIKEEDLEDFKIYLLDRNSNISYQTFNNLINKVDQITKIFPIFFLLVSALVVLTTMTRMIEEERLEIGTLRSLGYKKSTIYFKYIMYALIVGILGTELGYASGFRLIPLIISNAFKTIFNVAPLNLDIYSTDNLIYILVIVLSIIIVTIFSIRKTLKQSPQQLLIPRAPKYGTRIFLEKIPFIWNKLKFKNKSSIRNIFRYPKHLIMTVLGVMGSLALVFTGISLTSAVDAITIRQYEKIFKYDYEVSLSNNNYDDLKDYLNNKNIEYLKIEEFGEILTRKDTNETFHITVKLIDGNIDNFIKLSKRGSKKVLNLSNDGVIVTEQIAHYLKFNKNDKVSLLDKENILINGITENYLENYIYMTKEYYNSLNLEKNLNNKILINKNKDFNLEEFKEFDVINNISSLNDEVREKNRQLNQVKLLAIVIVLAAVFLQVIIIYNLMTVNISERDKELSTLKVLGYKDIEVSFYIFREINILTIIGIILGVPLGIGLQRYVILSVDSPNTMLGRDFGWYSFLSSIVLTIIMTILVELIMHFKIKKIDMISALKEL